MQQCHFYGKVELFSIDPLYTAPHFLDFILAFTNYHKSYPSSKVVLVQRFLV